MKIRHETPYPDLTFTVQGPLVLVLYDGVKIRLDRWALNGFPVLDDGLDVPSEATLSVPFQGVDITFPVKLDHDVDQKFVFFKDLTGRQRETLALFYRNLMSGQMSATEDIITSLDTPVDLVPMGETEEEKKTGSKAKTPRWFRVVYNLGIYLALSYLVFGILGASVWTRIDTIDIQHGRISAPEVALETVDDGYVYDVGVQPGDRVNAGDRLIKIRDARRDAEEDRANMDVKQARADLAAVLAVIDELESAEFALQAEAFRLARAAQLHARFFRSSDFQAAQMQWLALRKDEPTLAASFDPVALTVTRLKSLAETREVTLRTLKDVHKSRAREARALHVVAPVGGIVREVLAVEGTPVRAGTEVIVLETDDTRVAVGWASDKLAETLYVGMGAHIGFNRDGRVEEASGTIIDLVAGEDPTRPGEFGIIVTVAADGVDLADSRAMFRTSAPVNLTANRRLMSRAAQAGQSVGQRLQTFLGPDVPPEFAGR